MWIATRCILKYTNPMMRAHHVVHSRGNISSAAGFSLIELLVVVAILLVLTSLYWGPNRSDRQRALKRDCQKNLQKAYIALEIYANDNGGLFPRAGGARTSEEALDVLVPRYTSDTSIFICPGSGDSRPSPGEPLRKAGISYAYYTGRSQATNQALMSDRQVNTDAHAAGETVFSTTGKPPGNNHGKYGGNFLFSDGHVESTPAQVPFAIELGKGQALLNP